MSQTSQPGTGDAAQRAPRSARRTLTGRVMSTKMKATITVLVERTYKHEKYGKYVRERKRYHAHDAHEEARTGDLVEIMSTRPISKLKRWRFVRVVQKAVERGEDVTTEGALALRTESEA